MRVGEKVEVRVEGVFVLALARHHDDQLLLGDAAELGNSRTIVEDVLDHMRADDGVEVPVREGEVLDLGRDVFHPVQVLRILDNEIDTGEKSYVRAAQTNYVQQ